MDFGDINGFVGHAIFGKGGKIGWYFTACLDVVFYICLAPLRPAAVRGSCVEMKYKLTLSLAILLFSVLSVGIVAAGALLYQSQKAIRRSEADRSLLAVAELKVRDLSAWRKERLGDIGVFSGNPAFSSLVRRFWEQSDRSPEQANLRTWLGRVQASYHYDRIMLLDAKGVVRMSIPESAESPAVGTTVTRSDAEFSDATTFRDFYRDRVTGNIYLQLSAPIIDPQVDHRRIGTLVFRIDPRMHLYPDIERWPTPSKTAETLLIRREGDEAVLLNELKFQENSALTLRMSLDVRDRPAVRAALGQEGTMEGVDYRGVPVLAAARAVPQSPWFVVTKLDVAEAYAPLRRWLWLTVLFVGALLFGVIEGMAFLWRHQKARLYRQKYETEHKYRQLFENCRDALAIMEPPSWKFTSGNPAIVEMLRLGDVRELASLGLSDLFADRESDGRDTATVVREMIENTLRVGGHRCEGTMKRVDGEEFFATILLSKMSAGEESFIMATLRNITERKQAEERLRQSTEQAEQYAVALQAANKALEQFAEFAETATRTKSEFLANMSHEIRTPLTAILGYTDIMLEENVGRATWEHAAIIKRNGEHLLELINDILDLSKVEAGKLQIEPVRCSPFQLMAEVISLMKVRAEAKRLKLEADFASPLPETILTDPLRLRQILVNLVGNAIKFTDHGEVRIRVRLDTENGRPWICFAVADTGIGMNESQMARLFQPFSQVDSVSSRKYGGTGLGLCLSKGMAEVLGGGIAVESQAGKGSTFTVTIDPGPLEGIRMVTDVQAAASSRSSAAAELPSDKTPLHGRILLAEDGLDNQRLIRLVLHKAGADVTVVENGQMAVEAAMAAQESGKRFDLILMDMQMPVMDGYTATRELRTRNYAGPIVALTAHAMMEDAQKCKDAGCDDYATKPIDRSKFLGTVAKWMSCSQRQDVAPSASGMAPLGSTAQEQAMT